MTPTRRAALEGVARAVLELPSARIVRIGIDGVDGAGKTMFADELALVLAPSARPLIRAGVDAFHHPSPGGSGRFRRAIFDVDADGVVDAPEEQAAPGSILLFDGIFLHRPELRGYWDFSVFLHVEWVRNHRVRHQPDQARPRYSEGQALYLRECRPDERASVLIDHDDLDRPLIVRQS